MKPESTEVEALLLGLAMRHLARILDSANNVSEHPELLLQFLTEAEKLLGGREALELLHTQADACREFRRTFKPDSLASAKQAIAAYSALDELMNKC